jgi:hypothetical protein
VRYSGAGFREVERLTLGEARFWHNATAELERLIAADLAQR